MGAVADAIGDAVGDAVEFVGDTIEAVADNPLAAVAIVAAPYAAPAFAAAGVPAALATPVAAATISGATTLAQGGSLGDVLKSATAAGFGTYVGGQVAGSVGKEFGKVAGAAAGGAAGGATGAFIQTGDIEKALKSGLVAGGTAGIISAGSDALKGFGEGTTTTGDRTSGGFTPGQKVPTSPFGTTETVSATSPYGTMTYDTMPSMTYQPSFFETDVGQTIAEGGKQVAEQTISGQLAEVLGLIPSGAAAGGGGLPASTATYTGQGNVGAGTAALAQALRVADPGTPLFGAAGGQQKNVWNTESLRYKDQTGS